MIRPLDRRIRPQDDTVDSESDRTSVASGDSAPSIHRAGPSNKVLDTSDDGDSDEDSDEDVSGAEGDSNDKDPHEQLRSIQFGTLAKAQESLTRKRKREADTTPAHEDKLAALRSRLQELREQQEQKTKQEADGVNASKRRRQEKSSSKKSAHRETELDSDEISPTSSVSGDETSGSSSDDDDNDDDSDHEPSQQRSKFKKPSSRSSKHAPTIQSSTRQVSRNRTVIEPLAPRIKSRDPRFVNPTGSYDPNKITKTYAFLEGYKADELATMKKRLSHAKKLRLGEQEVEELRLQIAAEENRARAKRAAEREQDVIREHRLKEREAVKMGKTPFFLKKKDIKEQALVKRFEGMKGKERKRALEKKQKKEGQRFKRAMPAARRIA